MLLLELFRHEFLESIEDSKYKSALSESKISFSLPGNFCTALVQKKWLIPIPLQIDLWLGRDETFSNPPPPSFRPGTSFLPYAKPKKIRKSCKIPYRRL